MIIILSSNWHERKAEEEYEYLSQSGRPGDSGIDDSFWYRGTVTEGGPPSRIYDAQSRVFSVELQREEHRGCFAVYVGTAILISILALRYAGSLIQLCEPSKRVTSGGLPRMAPFTRQNSARRGRVPSMKKATKWAARRQALGEEAYSALSVAIR